MAATPIFSSPEEAATAALLSIGLGYDIADDLRFNCCKKLQSNSNSSSSSSSSASDHRLISIDDSQVRELLVPVHGAAAISIPNVPKSINCHEGEHKRFSSDVYSFQQMSELFNQEMTIYGKIPSGHFNTAFDFTGNWMKDTTSTKALAYDGVFITLYSVTLDRSQIVLKDHVKQAIPSTWKPAALARFIEIYGTHVIGGVKMGGADVIYVKQQYSSPLQPADVQKKMNDLADRLFTKRSGSQKSNDRDKFLVKEQGLDFSITSSSYSEVEFQDVKFNCKRKGGDSRKNLPHEDWCQTVLLEPDVVSMSFIPITSFLNGVSGSGFISHAINLYLRYKPPIEELRQFLEFQLPRQWAPVFGELPLGPDRRKQSSVFLQFSFLGPKLYVNTVPVDVGKKPVTGLRLFLEGKRCNCLAIHLQHLATHPTTFQLEDEPNINISHSFDQRYYEKVRWKSFSRVCTAPIESDDDLSVVTGAHFEVEDSGFRKVLFLRLRFSKVISAVPVRTPEWDGSPALAHKSGLISTSTFSTTQKSAPKPADVYINSAVYPGGPPMPTQTHKLMRFVDTTEITRGPQDSPGYWVVSGAKLHVEKGKISIRVKYSLLTVSLPDEEASITALM